MNASILVVDDEAVFRVLAEAWANRRVVEIE